MLLMTAARRWPAWLLGTALLAAPAWADFEITAPDGRKLLIKDDGTWSVVAAASAASAAASAPAPYDGPMSELRVLRRAETPNTCIYTLQLSNKFAYEIRSFVPEFVVERTAGVPYMAQTASFTWIRPGDDRRAELRWDGINCADVLRMQVVTADRCEMGELNRFTEGKGLCLARVKVLPSDQVKVEK